MTPKDSKDYYLNGLDEFVDAVTGGEGEGDEAPTKTDYRKKIQQIAEWKLREKQDKGAGSSTPKASPPKPKGPTTTPTPKKHGDAPTPPPGKEYYWYEPKGRDR
jgi:hypothetical protein